MSLTGNLNIKTDRLRDFAVLALKIPILKYLWEGRPEFNTARYLFQFDALIRLIKIYKSL